MGDFKKFGKKGDTFNRGPGGKPSFDSRPGFNRGGDERREMFKAVCAECGKPCEVPFKPSGDRPVYCRDCFAAMGPQDRGDRPFVKRDFTPRHAGASSAGGPRPYSPAPQRASGPSFTGQGSGEDKRLDDLKIQLATVISKLDKLINLQTNVAHTTPKVKADTGTLKDTLASIAPAATKKESSKPKKKSASKKK